MSSPDHTTDHDGPHEGPIKTPRQLIWAVALSFVVPILVIVLLVSYVTADKRQPAGSDAFEPQSVAARIQPVGSVKLALAGGAAAAVRTGEEVYKAACTACHAAGVAGAPKSGDTAAWAARIKTGYDALLTSALKGKGAMPAQGGGQFSDYEIGRAVVYMANQAGGKFDEPKAPAGATAAAPAAPATAPAPAAAAPAAAAPVAAPVAVAAAPAAAAGKPATPALYTQMCSACHAQGVAGAPKSGDKAAWAPRIAKGVDTLTQNALKGIGAMPPKGGAMASSDADIRAVVVYMVEINK
jgi:cytochrome c5